MDFARLRRLRLAALLAALGRAQLLRQAAAEVPARAAHQPGLGNRGCALVEGARRVGRAGGVSVPVAADEGRGEVESAPAAHARSARRDALDTVRSAVVPEPRVVTVPGTH